MLGEAPPQQTDQECTKGEVEVEVEVGSSGPTGGKHSVSLFSYLCIPVLTSLCFKITPLY